MTRTRAATASDAAVLAQGVSVGLGAGTDSLPSIRFSTFYDPRATRPSLTFSPVSRTLPTGTEIIRVGRYSERDSQPTVPINVPSAAPVGFKSKVVSRRHCEFWCEGGKWHIKDVKSSSGTFLNHIRLSPPGTESKPFPINDGDIVQLGIDFKGGEEMIFRCVKMRLELNRGWQNKLNTFNVTTHKRLRNMTRSSEGGSSGQTSQDCSICLNSIAPCQCLFVAPCSHTWHYKCIRSLLSSPQYPIFICPNCRAAADLEAEVEDPEEWERLESDIENADAIVEGGLAPGVGSSSGPAAKEGISGVPVVSQFPQVSRPETLRSSLGPSSDDVPNAHPVPQAMDSPSPGDNVSAHATSHPVSIPSATSPVSARRLGAHTGAGSSPADRQTRTPSPTGAVPSHPNGGAEGPITPRNDAGPWVFDGSGVLMRVTPPIAVAATSSTALCTGQMSSLDDIARP